MEIDYIFPTRIFSSKTHAEILTESETAVRSALFKNGPG